MYNNNDFNIYKGKLPVKGMHGYFSDSMNMHGIFYAFGSSIKEKMIIDTFELIHIYPLVCKILNIEPFDDIDGQLGVLKPILK